jgi:hypothetical protein
MSLQAGMRRWCWQSPIVAAATRPFATSRVVQHNNPLVSALVFSARAADPRPEYNNNIYYYYL